MILMCWMIIAFNCYVIDTELRFLIRVNSKVATVLALSGNSPGLRWHGKRTKMTGVQDGEPAIGQAYTCFAKACGLTPAVQIDVRDTAVLASAGRSDIKAWRNAQTACRMSLSE